MYKADDQWVLIIFWVIKGTIQSSKSTAHQAINKWQNQTENRKTKEVWAATADILAHPVGHGKVDLHHTLHLPFVCLQSPEWLCPFYRQQEENSLFWGKFLRTASNLCHWNVPQEPGWCMQGEDVTSGVMWLLCQLFCKTVSDVSLSKASSKLCWEVAFQYLLQK